jgi:hypothetical protein
MRQFITGLKYLAYPACFLIGLALMPIYGFVSGELWGQNIQTLDSPNAAHRASLLKKYNLADINFIVKVDGVRVYESPDLIPFADRSYREALVWDKTGRVVMLELMGKRVFAYDAISKRRLERGELKNYVMYPMASDNVYVYLKDIDE